MTTLARGYSNLFALTLVLLINETEAALNWIEANEMTANPEKFHLMFLSPNKQDLINQQSIDIRGISLKVKQNLHY